MEKRILVLKGSARAGGNSELLANALIKGAAEKGHKISEFRLADMKIGGCRGCSGCWQSKGNCIVADDMKKLEPYLENADVLVIASPLYWSSFPAQVKAVMDRVYEYDPVHGGKNLHIAESILLCCGETDQDSDFDSIRKLFQIFSEFSKMSVREMICVSKVNAKGDIKGNEALERAELLGNAL